MPLVDVFVHTFRDATQNFRAATHPRSEGLEAIPQIDFGPVLNDAGQYICALFAFRVGDDQNPTVSHHSINRAGFVVDVYTPRYAGFVV